MDLTIKEVSYPVMVELIGKIEQLFKQLNDKIDNLDKRVLEVERFVMYIDDTKYLKRKRDF